jgi:hypothetical protein
MSDEGSNCQSNVYISGGEPFGDGHDTMYMPIGDINESSVPDQDIPIEVAGATTPDSEHPEGGTGADDNPIYVRPFPGLNSWWVSIGVLVDFDFYDTYVAAFSAPRTDLYEEFRNLTANWSPSGGYHFFGQQRFIGCVDKGDDACPIHIAMLANVIMSEGEDREFGSQPFFYHIEHSLRRTIYEVWDAPFMAGQGAFAPSLANNKFVQSALVKLPCIGEDGPSEDELTSYGQAFIDAWIRAVVEIGQAVKPTPEEGAGPTWDPLAMPQRGADI